MKLKLAMLTIVLVVLSACGPTPAPQVIEKIVTQEVEVTQIVEVEGEVVTVVEVQVTVEPEPAADNPLRRDGRTAGPTRCGAIAGREL